MKKINKLIMCFAFFCFFFMNISGVGAANDCTCYYTGELSSDDNGDRYITNYLASINFNKSSFDGVEDKHDYMPSITFFGESGFNKNNSQSGKIIDKTDEAQWYYLVYRQTVTDILGWTEARFRAGVDENQVNALFESDCNCDAVGDLSFFSCDNSKVLYYNFDDRVALKIPGFNVTVLDRPLCGFNSGVRQDFELMTEEEFNEMKNSGNANETAQQQGHSTTVDIQKIIDWANSNGYDVDSVGDPCQIISPAIGDLLNGIFMTLSILGIILVVVMTAISFIKAIVGSDDEKFSDAFRHLLTRIITVIILLLLPMILSFIINIINDNFTGTIRIGDDGNVFCDVA